MASAVKVREVEMILSLTVNTSDLRGRQLCPSLLPVDKTQHYMASKTSETWTMILQLATSERASYFWSAAEGASLLVS